MPGLECMTRNNSLVVPIGHLLSDRIGEVEKLLRPLRSSDKWKVCDKLEVRSIGTIFASRDELDREKDYRERRLKTDLMPAIWFGYFEIWAPEQKGKYARLQRCYLHMYVRIRKSESLKPLMFLHSDPDFELSDNSQADEQLRHQCRHKQGPHLHVEIADYPLQKCHFPLNLGHLDSVLCSVTALTSAMSETVEIIRYEVLHEYRKRRDELEIEW